MRRLIPLFIALTITIASLGIAAPAPAAEAEAAKDNYVAFCAKCHGASGKADGPAAATLKTRPGDFTDCARMAKFPDDTMFNVIKNGGQAANLSKDMPPWNQGLEDDEIKALVSYVRSLCKK